MEKRRPNRKKRASRSIDKIALLAVLLIALLLVMGVRDRIGYYLLDFVPVESGTLEDKLPAKGLVICEESVIYAPAGEFVPAAAEGERVKAGALVGYLLLADGSKDAVYAPRAGCFLAAAAGTEGLIDPDTIDSTDLDALFALLAAKDPSVGESPKVAARIVDNLLDFYLLFAVPSGAVEGEKDKLAFYYEDSTIATQGKLKKILTGANSDYLLLTVSSGEEYLRSAGYFAGTVIMASYSGQIIPKTALIGDDEGNYSVLRRGAAKIEQAAVEFVGIVGEQAVVRGLGAHDLVIANPRHAAAGDKIY